MATVTVSPKFQIVIPKEIREKMKLKPGQKLFMFELNGKIHVESENKPITELRGIAKGLQWRDDYRDHSDRF
jgi:AbrB family looped-hinge helix DNA binding protein